jgi:hypothetical protein
VESWCNTVEATLMSEEAGMSVLALTDTAESIR